MTSSFAETVSAVLADPLATARAAARAVGFVGGDVPPELGLASKRVFCHLPWRAGRATPVADQWLESAFPGWARSMLEDWAAGTFDCFESVVFTRGDDAAQRLYYYVCELQRLGRIKGPRPLIFDVACIPRESSVRHTARALERLLEELEIDIAALAEGTAQANRRRAWYQRLAQQGEGDGRLREQLARAVLFRDLYAELGEQSLPLATGKGVLLAGSAPPDDRLHRAIAAVGWNVCGELHPYALARHGAALEATGGDNALMALARRLNGQTHGVRSFADRAALLEQELDRGAASAVVLWLTEEDESLVWDVARLREVLKRRAVPTLVLPRRRWDLEDGAPAEVARFLEGLQS